jgi:hypothetical protein
MRQLSEFMFQLSLNAQRNHAQSVHTFSCRLSPAPIQQLLPSRNAIAQRKPLHSGR